MEQEKHSKAERQRRQLAEQDEEGIVEEPVGLTDYILGFRIACLNRSVDIRNFAYGRDSFAINHDERGHLRELTEMLTEQTELLEDAWETMIKYAGKYKINLDKDDDYQALVLARNHALRVAEQAFSISDQFLYPQLMTTVHEAGGRNGQNKLHNLPGTTTKRSENVVQPQKADESKISTAAKCKQAVYATIEAIIAKTEDVNNPIVERERGETHNEIQSKTGEESEHEDPEEIIILDEFITALKKKGRRFDRRQNAIRERANLREKSREHESGKNTKRAPENKGPTNEIATKDARERVAEMGDHELMKKAKLEHMREINMGRREMKEVPGKITGPDSKTERGAAKYRTTEMVRASKTKKSKKHTQATAEHYPGAEQVKEGEESTRKRIIAKIDQTVTEPAAANGWNVQQHHTTKQNQGVVTSCTTVIAAGGAEYLVSGYKIGEANDSRILRCPVPHIVGDTTKKSSDPDQPRDGKEYEVDATLWFTPKSRDDIIIAWKRISQDPYARIRKGIGVCYHCGKQCGQPLTCAARTKHCYVCNKMGHTLKACEWRFRTKQVPSCSDIIQPQIQEQICDELTEYIDNFIDIMVDSYEIASRPTTILTHNATSKTAVEWLTRFKDYYETKREELSKRGYRQTDHGRTVLYAHIDNELQAELDRTPPSHDKNKVRGDQGCIRRLARYFNRKGGGDIRPQRTPIEPALNKEGWLIIDSLARHGGNAAHAREHEQMKRRKGYAKADERPHPASIPRDNQGTMITDLPNEILKEICAYLPFKDLQSIITATEEARDLSTIDGREGHAIDLSGRYLEERELSRVLSRKLTKFLDLTRAEIIKGTGAIETYLQVERSNLEGICISMFRGPYSKIAAIISMLDCLTTLDISYSPWGLISEVSRAMGERTYIKAINIGSSKIMMHCHPNDYEPEKDIIARLLRKCPRMRHFIVHGLNLCMHSITHLCLHLPTKMKSIDIARNRKFADDDVRYLMTRCPDLTFLDASDTGVTLRVIGEIARTWSHSLVSLALPKEAARSMRDIYHTGGEALDNVKQCIRSMQALIYLRMGRWRMGTAPESHQSENGNATGVMQEEKETATALKQIFPELTIHMSPYAKEDRHFYKQNGYPKPNPSFPPSSDPHYHFRNWGRGEGNFIQEDNARPIVSQRWF